MNKTIKFILVICTIFLALFCFNINADVHVFDSTSDSFVTNIKYFANCNEIFGCDDDPNQPMYWINLVLDIIRYVALIALLVLSGVDFIKAIVSNDKDALKKASKTTFKRFIYCVILFFLPLLVDFLLDLFEFND